jgi:hypothetical protein
LRWHRAARFQCRQQMLVATLSQQWQTPQPSQPAWGWGRGRMLHLAVRLAWACSQTQP